MQNYHYEERINAGLSNIRSSMRRKSRLIDPSTIKNDQAVQVSVEDLND